MPSLSSLEPVFLHCGVHSFFPMLLLRSSLSRPGAALAHLDSIPPYDLVLWTDSSVPFPLGKSGFGVLANCSLCGTEATLSFSAGPVCSSFSAKAAVIKQALCWSRHHQQVCHFSSLLLLYDSRSVLIILFSPPSFLLPQSFWQKLSSLSSCPIRLQWVPVWKISSSRSPKYREMKLRSRLTPKLWGSYFNSTSDSKNEYIVITTQR